MIKLNVGFEANYLFIKFDEESTIKIFGEYYLETKGIHHNLVVQCQEEIEDDDEMFNLLKPMMIDKAKDFLSDCDEEIILDFDWDGSQYTIMPL